MPRIDLSRFPKITLKSPRIQALMMGLIFSCTCLAIAALLIVLLKHPKHFHFDKSGIHSFFSIYYWWEWIFVFGAASSLFAQQTLTAYFRSYHNTISIDDPWNGYFNFISTAFLFLSIVLLDNGGWHYLFITLYTAILALWDWRTLRNNRDSRPHHEYISRLREAFHIDLPIAVALAVVFAAYTVINNWFGDSQILYVRVSGTDCVNAEASGGCFSSTAVVKVIDVVFAGATGYQMLVVTFLLLAMLARWDSPITDKSPGVDNSSGGKGPLPSG